MHTFDISSRKLVNYLLTLEAHYLTVPYHNSMHAADVAQAVHVLLLSPALDVSVRRCWLPGNRSSRPC
jgi:cAMP-specific phosphodiesterase 4